MRDVLAPVQFETPSSHSHFFGYYDKNPLDRTGRRLLAHRLDFDGRDVTEGDRAEVGYYDTASGGFTCLGATEAFNLQQGAMLQWLGPDYARHVVYNSRDGQRARAVVVDTETGQTRTLPSPVYAVHPSGAFALTLAFERLHACRKGYHYPGVRDPAFEGALPEADGIFVVDLEHGHTRRLLSLHDIVTALGAQGLDTGSPASPPPQTWLEHLMWNPSGSRFACLLRTALPDGQFWSRLFTADAEGQHLFAFPDTGVYSHMGWCGDHALTIWALVPNVGATARTQQKRKRWLRPLKPLYRAIKGRLPERVRRDLGPRAAFVHFQDQSRQHAVIADGKLVADGHNTWSADRRFMLTDTYADSDGDRHLMIYDRRADHLVRLGRFQSPFNDCGYRCDLHPRLAEAHGQVIIDSAHSGRRQVYVLDARQALRSHVRQAG